MVSALSGHTPARGLTIEPVGQQDFGYSRQHCTPTPDVQVSASSGVDTLGTTIYTEGAGHDSSLSRNSMTAAASVHAASAANDEQEGSAAEALPGPSTGTTPTAPPPDVVMVAADTTGIDEYYAAAGEFDGPINGEDDQP
ncbi:hypothetical protein ON010_g12506 [Phytophthora cinnamomi]|nr:hypothetical protein ON010_g12506 [Phytophthora cinnamomi]